MWLICKKIHFKIAILISKEICFDTHTRIMSNQWQFSQDFYYAPFDSLVIQFFHSVECCIFYLCIIYFIFIISKAVLLTFLCLINLCSLSKSLFALWKRKLTIELSNVLNKSDKNFNHHICRAEKITTIVCFFFTQNPSGSNLIIERIFLFV